MADRVSIKEVITSGDAGLTITELRERRLDSCCGLAGKDLRFRSLGLPNEVLAEVRSGMRGPLARSIIASRKWHDAVRDVRRHDQCVALCKGG